jgi:two-component sensor histidine kinase
MRARVVGTISVHLATDIDGRTALTVTDDGWGFDGSQPAGEGQNGGEGLKIAGDLAASAGGTVTLRRTHVTVATLQLPSPGAKRGVGHRTGCGVTTEQERG